MNWFIAHLVADYLLQTDWMAQGKKRSSWICWLHCLIYATTVRVFTDWSVGCWYVILVTHFIQDRGDLVKQIMLGTGHAQFAQPPLAPWSIIVVDNVLHLLVLYLIDCRVRQVLVFPGLGW